MSAESASTTGDADMPQQLEDEVRMKIDDKEHLVYVKAMPYMATQLRSGRLPTSDGMPEHWDIPFFGVVNYLAKHGYHHAFRLLPDDLAVYRAVGASMDYLRIDVLDGSTLSEMSERMAATVRTIESEAHQRSDSSVRDSPGDDDLERLRAWQKRSHEFLDLVFRQIYAYVVLEIGFGSADEQTVVQGTTIDCLLNILGVYGDIRVTVGPYAFSAARLLWEAFEARFVSGPLPSDFPNLDSLRRLFEFHVGKFDAERQAEQRAEWTARLEGELGLEPRNGDGIMDPHRVHAGSSDSSAVSDDAS